MWAAAVLVAATALTGCKQKLQQTSGVVTSVEIQGGDTLKAMRMAVDGDTLLFKLQDAQYTNGVAFAGDSAEVHYIEGRGDTLRALVVYAKPAPAQAPIDIHTDTTQVLLTR